MLLNCEGYSTVEAENGEEVLRLFDDTIDLVILDVMMPVMNGYKHVPRFASVPLCRFCF